LPPELGNLTALKWFFCHNNLFEKKWISVEEMQRMMRWDLLRRDYLPFVSLILKAHMTLLPFSISFPILVPPVFKTLTSDIVPTLVLSGVTLKLHQIQSMGFGRFPCQMKANAHLIHIFNLGASCNKEHHKDYHNDHTWPFLLFLLLTRFQSQQPLPFDIDTWRDPDLSHERSLASSKTKTWRDPDPSHLSVPSCSDLLG